MSGKHTVEKIGGTSMSQFDTVMKNVIIGERTGAELYRRIFVVSAYGGITNLLLENKKDGTPGVYGLFARNEDWHPAMDRVREAMLAYNARFEDLGLHRADADAFILKRLDEVSTCITELAKLTGYGHFPLTDYLPASREILASLGEVHSGFNSANILKAQGINARFVDLSGWMETELFDFDEMVRRHFVDVNLDTELPIATGYVKFREGIMGRFDRGYSEITFSKIAVVTGAREGIIHKEYHLSTGDPVLIGADKVKVIGNMNFDIADQLADLDMEAIHSKASKEMELCRIPIRVKNAFEPEHPGTLIAKDYVSPAPKVDIICGRDDLVDLEITDPEMVGEAGYDYRLLQFFGEHGISYILKATNANTIAHVLPEKSRGLDKVTEQMREAFPGADVRVQPVAVVCAIGSNMADPGFLARAANALAEAEVNVLAVSQCMPQVNMQFVIKRDDFEKAQFALHRAFFEI